MELIESNQITKKCDQVHQFSLEIRREKCQLTLNCFCFFHRRPSCGENIPTLFSVCVEETRSNDERKVNNFDLGIRYVNAKQSPEAVLTNVVVFSVLLRNLIFSG
jgi:hypothetical protein